jgi:hypothetical protein
MDFYLPRKLIFKAWNKETKLLMRLNSIECIKGELFKKDHILLQFTGLYDKQQEEVYDRDVVLIGSAKFIVMWDLVRNAWGLYTLGKSQESIPFVADMAAKAIRLCSYFESEKESN